MKLQRILIISTLIIASFSFHSCNKTAKVTRVAEDSVIDVSGRWNDTDSRRVAE